MGFSASALAMPIRCRWPPENSWPYRLRCSGFSPTSSQQFADPLVDLPCLTDLVDPEGFGDDVVDRPARIQRRVGVLEDDLHVAPDRPQIRRRHGGQFLTVELHRPRCRLVQLQHGPAGGRLTAAGFADQAERLARVAASKDTPSTACTKPTVRLKSRSPLTGNSLDQIGDRQQRPGVWRPRRRCRLRSFGDLLAQDRLVAGRTRRHHCSCRTATRGSGSRGHLVPVLAAGPVVDGELDRLQRPARSRRSPAWTSGQRGLNGHPGGMLTSDGGAPLIGRSRRPTESARGMEDSSPTVYGIRGSVKTVSDPPVSTIVPAYITCTRSAMPVTTPRSWVIMMIAADELVPQPPQGVQDLRLHGDVERGGRLVGDDDLGIVDHRHRDHHALPHATGEFVRILLGPPVRLRDADDVQHLEHPCRGDLLGHLVVCAGRPRPAASRSVYTGFSDVIGSWKIIAMPLPRIRRMLLLGHPDQFRRRRTPPSR